MLISIDTSDTHQLPLCSQHSWDMLISCCTLQADFCPNPQHSFDLSFDVKGGVVVNPSVCCCGWWRLQAPEVLLTGQLRLRSDVYSFGILLWELVHLGIPSSAASSSGLSWPSSTSQSSLLVSDPLAWPDEGQDEAGQHSSFTASAGAAEETQQPGSTADVSATQARRSKAVISSAYQELCAMPWIIANKVIEGMRPVFVAPAVPGPYVHLAKRCWDADPVKRPSFDEVVELLESVVRGNQVVATTPKDSDLSPSQHMGSF